VTESRIGSENGGHAEQPQTSSTADARESGTLATRRPATAAVEAVWRRAILTAGAARPPPGCVPGDDQPRKAARFDGSSLRADSRQ
jgi:hypothetical protein